MEFYVSNTKLENTQKFKRHAADYRKECLMDATIESIYEIGYAATTVREICKRAQVSPGLLRHYFKSKTELITMTYSRLLTDFVANIKSSMNRGDLNERQKLEYFVNACFEPRQEAEHKSAVMIAFWSELRLHPEMRLEAQAIFRSYRYELILIIENIAKIEGNHKDVDADLVAVSLTSLIDGLWLEMSLDPEKIKIHAAKSACFGLLDGFLFCGTNDKWLLEGGAGR